AGAPIETCDALRYTGTNCQFAPQHRQVTGALSREPLGSSRLEHNRFGEFGAEVSSLIVKTDSRRYGIRSGVDEDKGRGKITAKRHLWKIKCSAGPTVTAGKDWKRRENSFLHAESSCSKHIVG